MAWTKYYVFLALLLIVTGSINTLSTKWADNTKSVSSDGKTRQFHHPFVQADFMFVGEILCLVTFHILYCYYRSKKDGSEDTNTLVKGSRTFNPLILLIPAICDMISTSVMYVGLTLTYASSFQMFRGSVIIFVGIFSIIFLGARLKIQEWIGMCLVIIGLVVVGVSDFLTEDSSKTKSKYDIITGDLLIVAAQVVHSIQMVVQEKFVAGLDIPVLEAVGWEGLFGFVVLGLLHIPFYFIIIGPPFTNNPRDALEDALDAFVQMSNNYIIIIAIVGNLLSIAFFNFAGVSITKEISATTRMVLDSVRTVVIWIISISFLHQKFQWLQLLGFIILLYGMLLYNGITLMEPCVKLWKKSRRNDAEDTS